MLRFDIRGLRAIAPDLCRGKKAKELRRALSDGLRAVVCVRLNNPTYDGPTGSVLATPAAEAAVRDCVTKAFAGFLRDRRDLLQRFAERLELYD